MSKKKFSIDHIKENILSGVYKNNGTKNLCLRSIEISTSKKGPAEPTKNLKNFILHACFREQMTNVTEKVLDRLISKKIFLVLCTKI